MTGTVWEWGFDHYGPDQEVFWVTPVAVPGLVEVTDMAAGYQHAVAVKADGTVWARGANYVNQLGNGGPSNLYQQTPAQVPNLPSISKVASVYSHTLAVATDGTVWAWGSNERGELGDGTTEARSGPVQVSGLTGVIAIATNSGYSLAKKSDGTVWTWGDSAPGLRGDVDHHLPQQITLGLLDTNGNGMDDRWEIERFGDLNQGANDDFDGDGVSNLQEFLQGTDPTDYFNGTTPLIEIVSGNNQFGEAGTIAPHPLKVRVKSANGLLAPNAPVTFAFHSATGSSLMDPARARSK
jgi:hypothetical protein